MSIMVFTYLGQTCSCPKYNDKYFLYLQSDFSWRVVNNDHFLYWGDVVKTNEEGVDFHIQVNMN